MRSVGYNAGMNILALETSGESASVALWRNGHIIERSISAANQHSRVVLAMIDEILGEAKVSLHELSAIAFSSGPGAFTGLRIGCGVTQGLALGAGLTTIAIPTPLALAEASGADRVLAALDARMGEIYLAAYERDGDAWRTLLEPVLLKIELAPALAGRFHGVGSGFSVAGGALAEAYRGQLSAIDAALSPQANAVAALAARLPAERWLDPAELAPHYVRNKVALTIAER